MNELKRIFDSSYTAGERAFTRYRERCRFEPSVSSIRMCSELRAEAQQRLADRAYDLDMFARQLSDTAFMCGWSDAEHDE